MVSTLYYGFKKIPFLGLLLCSFSFVQGKNTQEEGGKFFSQENTNIKTLDDEDEKKYQEFSQKILKLLMDLWEGYFEFTPLNENPSPEELEDFKRKSIKEYNSMTDIPENRKKEILQRYEGSQLLKEYTYKILDQPFGLLKYGRFVTYHKKDNTVVSRAIGIETILNMKTTSFNIKPSYICFLFTAMKCPPCKIVKEQLTKWNEGNALMNNPHVVPIIVNVDQHLPFNDIQEGFSGAHEENYYFFKDLSKKNSTGFFFYGYAHDHGKTFKNPPKIASSLNKYHIVGVFQVLLKKKDQLKPFFAKDINFEEDGLNGVPSLVVLHKSGKIQRIFLGQSDIISFFQTLKTLDNDWSSLKKAYKEILMSKNSPEEKEKQKWILLKNFFKNKNQDMNLEELKKKYF